ncbi:hypothetical protein HHK36_016048 [Tetracentron sinense]|uniref:WEB family protein n=1 Tax=Tetracentron sinense TaxID=13715 RepID=A0A835DBL2_TETSI|nr:hypothetical protein HHK36_016048 [Tetracentron sinense]
MAETLETGCKGGTTECSGTNETLVSESAEIKKNSFKAEIDTSPPFESVKEAVSHFGGSGVWRPQHKHVEENYSFEEVDIAKVEEQAAQLEKDLIMKERETLDVLKELETTKRILEELKLMLQKEPSEGNTTSELNSYNKKINPVGDLSLCPTSSPGLILRDLEQAKLNLTRTTNDLAEIRASVESLNKKLEKERISFRKTRERLTSNSTKISSIERELNQARQKLQLAKDAEVKDCSENPTDISKELQQLSSEAEQFKKMAVTTKSEVLRAMTEIEQTKRSMKTAEIRWVAAKKMEEAARAAEAVALAEIKALSKSESSSGSGVFLRNSEGVTLSFEEYSSLTRKTQEHEEFSKKRVIHPAVQVDEANISKMEILKKVDEAAKEVKISKRALKEALNRVEAANRGKLAVEEALQKWRAEHSQKRTSVYNSAKFSNSNPSHHLRDSRLLDVNRQNLVSDGSKPVVRPTLSIGQILSRKLLLPEEFEMGMQMEHTTEEQKVSLGQMLYKQNGVLFPPQKAEKNVHKQSCEKREKLGFTQFSLLTKQSQRKKKQAPCPRQHNG